MLCGVGTALIHHRKYVDSSKLRLERMKLTNYSQSKAWQSLVFFCNSPECTVAIKYRTFLHRFRHVNTSPKQTKQLNSVIFLLMLCPTTTHTSQSENGLCPSSPKGSDSERQKKMAWRNKHVCCFSFFSGTPTIGFPTGIRLKPSPKGHPQDASKPSLAQSEEAVVLPRAHPVDLCGASRAQGILALRANVRGLANRTSGHQTWLWVKKR